MSRAEAGKLAHFAADLGAVALQTFNSAFPNRIAYKHMDGGGLYYESSDMDDAYHPQTILAYGLNGTPLPIANGAPLRLRVERQLGYESAKYRMRFELVKQP